MRDDAGNVNTPSFNMQAFRVSSVLSAIRITVILAFAICVNLCPAVEPTPISTSLYQTLIGPGFSGYKLVQARGADEEVL